MPQPLLSGEQQYVSEATAASSEVHGLKARIANLEGELADSRRRVRMLEASISALRHVLDPQWTMLRAVYGELEILGSIEMQSAEPSSVSTAGRKMGSAWQKWIEKFGVTSWKGKFIQSLLEHGPSTVNQLGVAMGCPRKPTIYQTANELSKLSLIRKNGDSYALIE